MDYCAVELLLEMQLEGSNAVVNHLCLFRQLERHHLSPVVVLPAKPFARLSTSDTREGKVAFRASPFFVPSTARRRRPRRRFYISESLSRNLDLMNSPLVSRVRRSLKKISGKEGETFFSIETIPLRIAARHDRQPYPRSENPSKGERRDQTAYRYLSLWVITYQDLR